MPTILEEAISGAEKVREQERWRIEHDPQSLGITGMLKGGLDSDRLAKIAREIEAREAARMPSKKKERKKMKTPEANSGGDGKKAELPMKRRICKRCELAFPANSENFHKKGKKRNGEDRLDTFCKECRNQIGRDKEAAKKGHGKGPARVSTKKATDGPPPRVQALLEFLDPVFRGELETYFWNKGIRDIREILYGLEKAKEA